MPFNVYLDDIRPGPQNKEWLGYQAAIIGENVDLNNWQDWVIVRGIENCKILLQLGLINDISLDHDMGEQETGMDLVKWICETGNFPNGIIEIHSANFDAAQQMRDYLKNFTTIKEI
jgi:hypothetical protein